jgi:hypothetical protein
MALIVYVDRERLMRFLYPSDQGLAAEPRDPS